MSESFRVNPFQFDPRSRLQSRTYPAWDDTREAAEGRDQAISRGALLLKIECDICKHSVEFLSRSEKERFMESSRWTVFWDAEQTRCYVCQNRPAA